MLHPAAGFLDRVSIDPARSDIVLDQLRDGDTDGDLLRRIIEQFHIGSIPSHKALFGIHHADPLLDVLQHGLQHVPFEPGSLGLLIQHGQHIRQGHIAATNGGEQHNPRRGRTKRACQKLLRTLYKPPVRRGISAGRDSGFLFQFAEGMVHSFRRQEARGQRLQPTWRNLRGLRLHRAFSDCGKLVSADKGSRLYPVTQSLARAQGDDDEQRKIDTETDHNAMGQAVFYPDAEHGVGMQKARHICCNRIRLQNGRQEQRVRPQHHTGDQPGQHAGASSAAPCHRADQTGRELRRRRKGQKPDLCQGLARPSFPVIDISEQQDNDDHNTPRRNDAGTGIAAQAGKAAGLHDRRNDQIIRHHGRECDGGNDHHAGGRRKPAQENHGREQTAPLLQRQIQHEQVRLRAWPEHGEARQRNRHDHQACEENVEREYPARHFQIVHTLALDHGDMELPRQTDDCGHGQQRHRHEPFGKAVCPERLHGWAGVSNAAFQEQHDGQDRNGHQRRELQHGLQRQHAHQAGIMPCRI